MAVMNYFVLFCTILNMIRVYAFKFDIWLLFGLTIALSRCLFQLRLCCCCDSIHTRRQLVYVMNLTTALETLIFMAQISVLIGNIHNADVLCEVPAMPTFGIDSCSGVLSFVYSTNAAFIVLYMYFCCVTYEHYWMSLKNPAMIIREAKRINQVKKDKEALEAAALAAAEKERQKLIDEAI
jgi:hypothetical protein